MEMHLNTVEYREYQSIIAHYHQYTTIGRES